MDITKEDKALIKGLNQLLNDATFPLKQREVPTFVRIVTWAKELEKRLDKAVIKEDKKEK